MRQTALLLVLLLLPATALASITLVTEMDSQVVAAGDIVELGEASPGETLYLTVSSEHGQPNVGGEWTKLYIDQATLPEDWNASGSQEAKKTLTAQVIIPAEAELDAFKLRAVVEDEEGRLPEQDFYFWLFIKKNLIVSSINNPDKKIPVNQPVDYELKLINNSMAGHKLKITSSLAPLWFEGEEVELKPKESKTLALTVTPRVYGYREFTFYLTSEENGTLLNLIPARIDAQPVLTEKYATGLYGFPFFSLSLLPFYLVEGFLGQWLT